MGGADLSLKEGAVVHEAIRYADHMPRLERPEENNCARCVGLAGEDEGEGAATPTVASLAAHEARARASRPSSGRTGGMVQSLKGRAHLPPLGLNSGGP